MEKEIGLTKLTESFLRERYLEGQVGTGLFRAQDVVDRFGLPEEKKGRVGEILREQFPHIIDKLGPGKYRVAEGVDDSFFDKPLIGAGEVKERVKGNPTGVRHERIRSRGAVTNARLKNYLKEIEEG